jgi:hypothetical protein
LHRWVTDSTREKIDATKKFAKSIFSYKKCSHANDLVERQ